MRASTKLLIGLLLGSLGASCSGADGAENDEAVGPVKGKTPPAGGGADANLDVTDFEVNEGEIILPDEAKAKAEAEITDANADEMFEALKSSIESGG